MELTFLKLVGPHTTTRRGEGEERGEREGRRRSGQEKRRSKKDRSAEASWVDGDNGSLGIALSIFGPLGPLGTTSPYGHYRSTPFHSIPPLFHPLRLPWKLSRYHTPLLVPGKTPPSNTALPKLGCRASPVPTFLAHDAPFPWMYMHGILPPRLSPSRIHLSEHLYCILYNVHAFLYQTKLFWRAARLTLMDRLWYTLRNILNCIES